MVPRSTLAIGLDPKLQGRLSRLAAGRSLVIDFFATRCCSSVLVGDLTVRWTDEPPQAQLVELAPIEGVSIAAEPSIVELLETAGPTLRLAGLPFARHLALELDDPAAWIDFLATPPAFRRRKR